MIRIEKTFNAPDIIPYPSLGDPGKVLLFDIETTGLSPYASELYLIGAAFQRDSEWRFCQWFSESLSDEIPVLNAFSAFLRDFETLVDYNGDTFDVPYLKALYEQYHLPSPFRGLRNVDLMKSARRIRPLLNSDSLKQKDVEKALGIRREDIYTGGELIYVYKKWQESHDERLLRDLLLHNEDDVKGLAPILPILSYDELLLENLRPVAVRTDRSSEDLILIEAEYPFRFPFGRRMEGENGFQAVFGGKLIRLRLPVFSGELKKFLPNPKAYYYLPKEDMIIPREIGSGVDPMSRVPAKKETCYIRLRDEFIPWFPGLTPDTFKSDLSDKWTMMRLSDADWGDYLNAFLKNILTFKPAHGKEK
jgi:uncharacterized protein YprB with RNaseH-like and TPR domain